MKTARWFCAAALVGLVGLAVRGQEPPKPGPEHAILKRHEGTWATVMKSEGKEFPGTATYKMDLGGLWLASTFETDMGGVKFAGKGFDTYDAGKKKYVSVWVDSMGTTPMVMEGTFDAAKKAMTLVGDGPDMTGKTAKWKSVTTMPNDDTINFAMFVGDGKEPMFTIDYKRKK